MKGSESRDPFPDISQDLDRLGNWVRFVLHDHRQAIQSAFDDDLPKLALCLIAVALLDVVVSYLCVFALQPSQYLPV